MFCPKNTTNNSGGKGYFGYINNFNSTYFKCSISDTEFDHYPVNIQWFAIGY